MYLFSKVVLKENRMGALNKHHAAVAARERMKSQHIPKQSKGICESVIVMA